MAARGDGERAQQRSAAVGGHERAEGGGADVEHVPREDRRHVLVRKEEHVHGDGHEEDRAHGGLVPRRVQARAQAAAPARRRPRAAEPAVQAGSNSEPESKGHAITA